MIFSGENINEQDDIASDARMMNRGYQNGDSQATNMGRADAIFLPPLDGNPISI